MRFLIASLVVLAACAAPRQTLRIVNRTDRTIEAVYVYAPGAADQGPSRATLAPDASHELQVKAGALEVRGVSAKIQVDARTRDQPSASQVIEVRGPSEVVFFDDGARPAGIDRPGVFGVAFRPPASDPAPDPEPALPE